MRFTFRDAGACRGRSRDQWQSVFRCPPLRTTDITVIDMRSPHLDGFGDSVAVMVLGAGPADVETAIVGGDVLKRDGKLMGVHVDKAHELMRASREHLRERTADAERSAALV
jgi:hypothetical protein